MTQSFFFISFPSGLNAVLLLFASSVLNLMVLTNPFDSVELTCAVLLELVAGIDDTLAVACDVKGVNAESGEKLPVKGSLFILLAAECGLAGRPIAELRAWLFKLELRVKGACSFMVRFDETFPQIDGDGGAGAGSKPDPVELPSDPTSRSVGEGRSLKKNPFTENGLLMGLKPPSFMLEPLLLG